MTSTDIIGERTALERLIYELDYLVDTRLDDGASPTDILGDIGMTIKGAQEIVGHLESILSKYRMLEQAAEQFLDSAVEVLERND